MMRRAVWCMVMLCLRARAQETACAIGGTVVDGDSNKPVVRARVMAEVERDHAFLTLTDERGGFCFARLNAASYRVSVQKAGYLETRRAGTLAVEDGAGVKPLALRLVQLAGLAGVVLDEAGNPAPGVEVRVWERVRDGQGWGPSADDSTTADGLGVFRFSELAPGTYYLSARPEGWDERRFAVSLLDSKGETPLEKEVETFYSGSLTFAGATPVEAKAGQPVEHLVLTLKKTPVRRISGRIANPQTMGYLVLDHKSETGSAGGGTIDVAKDGSFTREGLPPGRYTLRLREGSRLLARRQVDLTNGDAVGIILEPLESVDVRVNFHTEGKGPAFQSTTGSCGFLEEDGSDDAVMGMLRGDGTCAFRSVPRGVYRVGIGVQGQQLYVKKLVYGGQTLANRELDLRNGADGDLEVTLSPNVAEVQGHVEGESEGVTVILVDGLTIAAQAETDQKGRFRMGALAPGKYRLLAVAGFDEDDWGSAELAKALAGKAVELELKESEKRQVRVTGISEEEWDAAVERCCHQ